MSGRAMKKLDSPAVQSALAKVTHIYTDLDGTLLAPGGRLLTDHHGKPSLALAESLVRLKQQEVEIIIVTGRSAASSVEIMRLADLEQFIGEMGCVVQCSYGSNARKRFILGEWSSEHFDQGNDGDDGGRAGITPYETISRSGALSALLEHFKGRLERLPHGGSPREVTLPLRGDVDTAQGGEVEQVLSECELPLQLLDNGIIHPTSHSLIGVEEVHIYHLMPRGTGKGEAVAADMREKGLAAEQCLAIGDAASDVAMGRFTGSFVLMDNGKELSLFDYAEKTVANPGNLFTTSRPTSDGWTEFAHALLEARSR